MGAPKPGRYDHVVWILMENKPRGRAVGHPGTPRLTAAAKTCAVAQDYRAVTHPSLPNYLALTSGTTHGVHDDHEPADHPLRGASLFSEVTASAQTWATYAESMRGTCGLHGFGRYAPKHNPAAYYTDLRAACRRNDVPLGTPTRGPLATALARGTLPAFSLVVPDLCGDTHDCPVATGDAWLGRWLHALTASATYRQGRTAIFVTWDEDDYSAGNRIDLVALAPALAPGSEARGRFTHFSLLRTTEELLGLRTTLVPQAPSMRSAFGL